MDWHDPPPVSRARLSGRSKVAFKFDRLVAKPGVKVPWASEKLSIENLTDCIDWLSLAPDRNAERIAAGGQHLLPQLAIADGARDDNRANQ